MASTYSPNLAIELIGTGDQAGAWGNTTNTNLGTLIEQAISGYVTQAVSTGTDTSITIPNGATGVARNMYIELTGTGGSNTNLIVPANKKLYFVYNNTSSGQVTVKVAGQTGISVPNGLKVVLVCNGTDIVEATSYINSLSANITTLTAVNASFTSLTLTNALKIAEGGTGLDSTPTNGQLLIGNGTGYALSTLSAGTGISITNAAGSITLTATNTSSGTITSVTASSPLASSGGATPDISIGSSTGSGAVVLASGAQFSATSANITTLSSTSANITTLTGTSATITNILDGAGNIRQIPSAGTTKTSTYTLSVTDVGEFVTLGTGGTAVVPNGVFSPGDAVSIFNNTAASATITLSITTAYISGTDSDKASVLLAPRGVATILFISNSLCVLGGSVT